MLSMVEFVGLGMFTLVLAHGVVWGLQRWVNPAGSAALQGAERDETREYWGSTGKANFHYVRRRTRYLVQYPVTYRMVDGIGQGVVVDIAGEGWRIRGAHPIPVGTVMSLMVSLPGHAMPVPISRAEVRWSRGMEYGIRLLALDPLSAAHLSELYCTLADSPTLVASAHD
jgi:hypothetical protein